MLLLLALFQAFANPAQASKPAPGIHPTGAASSESPAQPIAIPGTEPKRDKRGTNYIVSLRGGYFWVPNPALNLVFQEESFPPLEASSPRPTVHAYTLGGEFTLRQKEHKQKIGGSNGTFYVEYAKNLTKAGYWTLEDTGLQGLDAVYVVPSDNLGAVVLGANYAYEFYFVKAARTKGLFGLSMLVGIGGGIAFLTGHMDAYSINTGGNGKTRHENGEDPDYTVDLPPVGPVFDLNLALRFNIVNRLIVEVEGGIHGAVFMGSSVGVMF